MEMTEQEEREIRQYVESQTADRDNEVQLVQRVGRRRIAVKSGRLVYDDHHTNR